jgi:hypothetical protein
VTSALVSIARGACRASRAVPAHCPGCVSASVHFLRDGGKACPMDYQTRRNARRDVHGGAA